MCSHPRVYTPDCYLVDGTTLLDCCGSYRTGVNVSEARKARKIQACPGFWNIRVELLLM